MQVLINIMQCLQLGHQRHLTSDLEAGNRLFLYQSPLPSEGDRLIKDFMCPEKQCDPNTGHLCDA